MAGSGYKVGPTLAPSETPWPVDWERNPIIDFCDHTWETVLVPGHHIDEVARCSTCFAPRCGHVHDGDPCMKRRHHRACHVYLSGRSEHLSGLAATCGCNVWSAPSTEETNDGG